MAYDPTVARWTAEDPVGFDAGDPNLYRYVGNSPANYVDPFGLRNEQQPVDARKGEGKERKPQNDPSSDPIKLDPIRIPPPSPPRPLGGLPLPDPDVLAVPIAPTGNRLRDPEQFPEVTDACEELRRLSAMDPIERGVGVYQNRDGDIQVGIPSLDGKEIVRENLRGLHDLINLNRLGNPPKGWRLVCAIHTHPPDRNPATKDPKNSPFDPVNSNGPIGRSPRVPWLVVDSDGEIHLIGPDARAGTPNSASR